tara:strand:- start:270 stop:449 length:180 start_codon:yes stop_codon:yes gene_type:complete
MSYVIGDRVRVEWVDGLIIFGTYVGKERSFSLIVDEETGSKVPCGLHTTIRLAEKKNEN